MTASSLSRSINESSVLLAVGDPLPMLETLVAEMDRRDMDVSRLSPVEAFLDLGGSHLRIEARRREGLLVTIKARGVVTLHRIKHWVVEHIEELLPGTTGDLHWSDDFERTLESTPPYFHEVTVLRKRQLSSLLLRLTFKVRDMDQLGSEGIHVRLLLPPGGRRPVWPALASNGGLILPGGDDALTMRYYTIRAVRPEAGEIDIDFVRHRGGAMSDWAETCATDTVIGLLGPSGFQQLPLDGPLLIAADGTAAPAVARMIKALAEGVSSAVAPVGGRPVSGGGHVFLGLGTDGAALSYLEGAEPAALGLTVHGIAPSAFDDSIEAAVRSAFDRGPPAFAWFAGERQTAQRLRILFRNRFGLGKGSQFAIAYWNRREAEGEQP